MNQLFLMQHPDLFQGEKYLKTNKPYFEGWYFKNANEQECISFIPGISIEETSKAFIQVITNHSSYFVPYAIEEFSFTSAPFSIQIGKNLFTKNGTHIDIQSNQQNLTINGELHYSNNHFLHTSLFSPNIMGPFSYVPFMECNHAILSMQNKVNGDISINHQRISFHHDTGYIEKDWGCSFPKSYLWCQGNQFQNANASFMLSIATIPFTAFHFRGIICVFVLNGIEYKFTTYNGAKLIECQIEDDFLKLTLKKGAYCFTIESPTAIAHKLSAPIKGKMAKDIQESISSSIHVTLRKNGAILFSDTSTHCGLEIVQD